MHNIDLNAKPLSDDDELSFENSMDYMVQSGCSTKDAFMIQKELPTLTKSLLRDEDVQQYACATEQGNASMIPKVPTSSINSLFHEGVQQNANANGQDNMHYINLNATPLFDDDELSFEYSMDDMVHVSQPECSTKDVFMIPKKSTCVIQSFSHNEGIQQNVSGASMILKEPISSINSFLHKDVQHNAYSNDQDTMHCIDLNASPFLDVDEQSVENLANYIAHASHSEQPFHEVTRDDVIYISLCKCPSSCG